MKFYFVIGTLAALVAIVSSLNDHHTACAVWSLTALTAFRFSEQEGHR